MGNHSCHNGVSLAFTINQFFKQEEEKKEIAAEIEIDEINELEKLLNEWKSINNKEHELIEKLLKQCEK